MEGFTRDAFKALVGWRNGPCVSIYMPLHRAGAETQQEPIRLKNVLREADRQLVAAGMRAPEARALLEPAWKLHDDEEFWVYHCAHGLALFVAPGLFRHFGVAQQWGELVVVGERFHIQPLVGSLAEEGRFYVLALSQNAVRLFEGTRLGLSSLALPANCPSNIDEAQARTQFDRSLQFHASGQGGDGGWVGMVHGHAPDDLKKKWLEKYVRTVAQHIGAALNGERAPLVLAAVDYYQPIARDAIGYAHVMDQGIIGSPDSMTEKALHEQAWAIAQPWFHRQCEEAAERYRRLSGSERVLSELDRIVPAACSGRVDVVFAAAGMQVWGRHDMESQQTAVHDRQRQGDIELLNLAIEQTLLHGGDAYVVDPSQLPGTAPKRVAAATLRW